jgi:hypothetical protein
VRGNPPPSLPPTQDEVLEELSVDPRRAPIRIRHGKCTWPSGQAKEEFQRIDEYLSTLVTVAQSGIHHETKRKDIKRKYDRYRYFVLESLAIIYERTFNKKASTRREGAWIIFLSRIISILDDEETSPDAAYDTWLTIRKLSPGGYLPFDLF